MRERMKRRRFITLLSGAVAGTAPVKVFGCRPMTGRAADSVGSLSERSDIEPRLQNRT
jgi:hypothetical protein